MKKVTVEYCGGVGAPLTKSFVGEEVKPWTTERGSLVIFVDIKVAAEFSNYVSIVYSDEPEPKKPRRKSMKE